MKGVYTFRKNGEVVAISENIITSEGALAIMRYLAKYSTSIAQSISIGLGTAAASVSDTKLQFEFDRMPITLTTGDMIAKKIIYKATVPQSTVGTIYEAGAWSQQDPSSMYVPRLIFAFDSMSENWNAGTFTADPTRIGGDSLRLAPTSSTTQTSLMDNIGIDLSGYSNNDQFSLAFNVGNSNAASVKLRLKTDSANYYEYTISSPTSGYKIVNFVKSDFVATGVPSWDNITSSEVSVTATSGGAAQVDFDGLRIDDQSASDPDYVLVSRTVLASPYQKTADAPLEIEYALDVTIS